MTSNLSCLTSETYVPCLSASRCHNLQNVGTVHTDTNASVECVTDSSGEIRDQKVKILTQNYPFLLYLGDP